LILRAKAARGDGAPLRTTVRLNEGWRSGCSIEPKEPIRA
jgi:hypothetical protein